jgi:hypothetical protein
VFVCLSREVTQVTVCLSREVTQVTVCLSREVTQVTVCLSREVTQVTVCLSREVTQVTVCLSRDGQHRTANNMLKLLICRDLLAACSCSSADSFFKTLLLNLPFHVISILASSCDLHTWCLT